VRCAFVVCRDAHRAESARAQLAAERIQRFLRWCVDRGRRKQHEHARSVKDLLLDAQQNILRAKERVARGLQSCFRRRQRRSTDVMASFVLDHSRGSGVCIDESYRSKCAKRIQKAWKRYVDIRLNPYPVGRSSIANVIEAARPGTGSTAARRSIEATRHTAARKIQAQYRRKTIRESLGRLKRVPAAPSASVIQSLIAKLDENHRNGVEPRASLSSLETIEQRRALFECPTVIFRGEQRRSSLLMTTEEARPEDDSGSETPPAVFTRHLANAIQFSASLRCLVCVSGDFGAQGVVDMMRAVGAGKSVRVLAIGPIETGVPSPETSEADQTDPNAPRGRAGAPSAMQTLSKAVRTANFLLEELYLEGNTLLAGEGEGELLAEIVGDFFFARYGHLHTLAVARMHLSDAAAELLAAALSINTALRHLDLHGNRLSDATASAFATRGLPFNSTLRYLNLADNAVASSGASALFQCLERDNHALETLVLSNNNVQNDAVDALRVAWQANAALGSVELAGNLVHADHLRELAAAADERRAVAPTSAELRLFLARRRFSTDCALSPPPLKGSKGGGSTRPAPLSPHRWLQQRVGMDAQALASPIRSPAAAYKARRKPPPRSPGTHSPPPSAPILKRLKGAGGNGARREIKLPALDSRNVW
jgi:hypothetical protein